MKKLVSLMLLIVAIVTTAVLSSCGDDNDNPSTTSVAGVYSGNDALKFSFQGQDYSTTAVGAKYDISQNKDGSLNIVFPEETFDFSTQVPMVGKIVQGSYVVKNVPFDKAKNAYYLDYSGNAKADVTVFGKTDNYELTVGEVTVTFNGSNVKVVNDHKFGKMPFQMCNTFDGAK